MISWVWLVLSLATSASGASIAGSDRAFRSAKNAWRAGDEAAFVTNVKGIDQGVELAYQALAATGDRPRERLDYFKRAEIALARLLRRLQFFQSQVCYDDRAIIERTAQKLGRLHSALLTGVTSGTPLSGFGQTD